MHIKNTHYTSLRLLFSIYCCRLACAILQWMWLSLQISFVYVQILFVYFLTLPSLLHPSIYSIVFILVSVLFYCPQRNLSMPSYMDIGFISSTLNGPSIEDGRCRSSCVRAKFVTTPLTFLCLANPSWPDKEAAMRLFDREKNFELCW